MNQVTGTLELAEDQIAAFNEIESSQRPIYVTGAAGTGKSALLKHLRDFGKDAGNTAVVAFTGAAAVNVDGTTIHALALQANAQGNSIQVYVPLDNSRELKKKNFEVIRAVNLLIIDEVSMARADYIDALDRSFRQAKDQTEIPFGGARLVMFGDLFQLPPFVPPMTFRRERKFLSGYENSDFPYFFQAHVFSTWPIKRVELHLPKRQSEQHFIAPLNEIRTGNPNQESLEQLNQLAKRDIDPETPHLFARRRPAREYNEKRLNELEGELHSYQAQELGFDGQPVTSFETNDDNLPAPRVVRVKVGATVMLLRNLDFNRKLVNGATGVIVSANSEAVSMKLHATGQIETIGRTDFDLLGYVLDSDGDNQPNFGDVEKTPKKIKTKIIGTYRQLPIMLAWGITIHKAQGSTLEKAAIDLSKDFPSSGQAYVALSRLKSVEGLGFIGSIGRNHLKPYAKEVYEFLDNPYLEGSISDTERTKNLAWVESQIKRFLPFRTEGWAFETVDLYFTGIPQLTDASGFNHKRRVMYLNNQGIMRPSDYLRAICELYPEKALGLLVNIDRSVRNEKLILGDNSRHVGSGKIGPDLPIGEYSILDPIQISWKSTTPNVHFILKRKGSFFYAFRCRKDPAIFEPQDSDQIGGPEETMLDLIDNAREDWSDDQPEEIVVLSEIAPDNYMPWVKYLFVRPEGIRISGETLRH